MIVRHNIIFYLRLLRRYKNLERHLRCVDVFTRRCMTVDQRRVFYRLYSVPSAAMQDLCTENGPYQDGKLYDIREKVKSSYIFSFL